MKEESIKDIIFDTKEISKRIDKILSTIKLKEDKKQ